MALLGPRQCGKTTLAKSYIETLGKEQKVHYFDLEKPSSEEIFANPYTILEDLEGLIVIYPGKERYKFSDKITIIGLQEFLQGE